MKSFKNFVSEENFTSSFENNPSNGYFSPEILKRINAIIGAKIVEDQSDSERAVAVIRNSLSKFGVTFDAVPSMVQESGKFEMPLTLFGGRFGKDLDTPHNEFLEDDGISNHVEGGLALHISYEMTDTNQCRLRAHIE